MSALKHKQLLDLVLNELYKTPGKTKDVVDLLKARGVDVSLDEAQIIGARLQDEGLVRYIGTKDSAYVTMKSEGIEFVEGTSFYQKGQSVINQYTINNSPNANLVAHSTNTTINQGGTIDAKHLLDEIRSALDKDQAVNEGLRQEIIDCLEEIETSVEQRKAPKFAFRSLMELSSNVTSVAGFVMQLGQTLQLIPLS